MTSTTKDRTHSVHRTQSARHLAIVEVLLQRGSLSVEDIGTQMGVSVMTVYRDVTTLEEAGLLQREHGRVTAVASGLHEASAGFRLEQKANVKAALATLVANRIAPGSSLMLDDSTSGVFVLRALEPGTPLTVITNSLLVARQTNAMSGVKLFMTGGEYQGWADALLGPTSLKNLSGLDADYCVLSASGIQHGQCFHPHEGVAEVKKAMMQSARFTVLLLESGKLRRHALHAFARVDEFDLVVVDDRISAEEESLLRDWGATFEVTTIT